MWKLLREEAERNSPSNWIWIQHNPDPNPRSSSFDPALCRLRGGRRFWSCTEKMKLTVSQTDPQTRVLGGPQFTQRQMMSCILASQSGLTLTDRSIWDKASLAFRTSGSMETRLATGSCPPLNNNKVAVSHRNHRCGLQTKKRRKTLMLVKVVGGEWRLEWQQYAYNALNQRGRHKRQKIRSRPGFAF